MSRDRDREGIQNGESSGFVLVGVVIFVLALTILAISLFSLSGYEGEFMERSARETQVFYDASGGIEWAKFVLARQKTLDALRSTPFPSDVIYARARRVDNGDTTGTVDFSGTVPLEIRVLADDGRGARRMVEARFTPQQTDDLYRRLFTSASYITAPYKSGIDSTVRLPQTYLNGPTRQVSSDIQWAAAPGTRPVPEIGPVPMPQAASFISDHWSAAGTQDATDDGAGHYTLTGSILSSQPAFFRPPWGLDSLYDNKSSPSITVNGTVVWMFKRGMRFDNVVTIQTGNPLTSRLIIVARGGELDPTHTSPSAGIWFFSGFNSPMVPVILVSDDRVVIESSGNPTANTTAPELSVFSNGVFVLGPLAGWAMTLTHDAAMDAVLDQLYDLGVLPNKQAGQGIAFQPVTGSWREVTASNPS